MTVGPRDGFEEGEVVGTSLAVIVGSDDRFHDGRNDGDAVGELEGPSLRMTVGPRDGFEEDEGVGTSLGEIVGSGDGFHDGLNEGRAVGEPLGALVGSSVREPRSIQ